MLVQAVAVDTPIVSDPADAGAVENLLQRLYQTWGNADAYAGLFTEDADYIAFDGTHTKGRAAIADSHRPLFERFLKNSRLYGESSATRFLSPDVALIHSKGAVLRAGQQFPSRRRLSIQTIVVVKQADGWRFAAFHNTRYQPFAQTLLGKLLGLAGLAPGS